MKYRARLALLALPCTTIAPIQARAQAPAYPTKTITFVVPAPPGGAVDIIARAMATEMGRRMGQTIIVDNKPGATGMLAAQTVARAAPDGYTLLITHSTPILAAPYLYSKMAYDPKTAFAFVSQICTGQLLFVVNPAKVPVKNMTEFMAWAQKNKGHVSYGSYGIGSQGHLMGAYMSESRNLDMLHVAYKGEPPMLQDLMGGQINWAIATSGTAAPQIQSGRLRGLAVMGDHRLPELPDVPTMAEAGFPQTEYKTMGWVALLAPAKTPAPVLARLEKEARAAAMLPAIKTQIESFGFEPLGTTSEQFRRDFQASSPVIERLIKLSGAKVE